MLERWDELERDLVGKAGQQMARLNQAYDAIKSGFSESDILGVSSLWERDEWKLHDDGPVVSIHEQITLKSDAYLFRHIDFHREGENIIIEKVGTTNFRCATGYDEVGRPGAIDRIVLPLKILFAFLELSAGRTIHPVLLTDIAEAYELDAVEMEELRAMLCERRGVEEICNRFAKEKERPWWYQGENIDMETDMTAVVQTYGGFGEWVHMILHGPRYAEDDHSLPYSPHHSGRFGVEYSRSGALHITLPCQTREYTGTWQREVVPLERIVIPAEDVAIMKQVAYSRSLGGFKKPPAIG